VVPTGGDEHAGAGMPFVQADSLPPPEPVIEPEKTLPTAPAPREARGGAKDEAVALAESFRRQKADVVMCVNEHADVVERIVELGVRFTIAADGKVMKAQVSPSQIAQTPLGTCIERAALAMRFARQKGPMTFDVPLTARKGP
jgi:hypothetical protein